MDPYPQIEVHDFVRLMKDFLDRRIDVRQYQRRYFDLSKKRFIVTDEEDKILQQAYGDADDFDDVVHLEYTINEELLRERISLVGKAQDARTRGPRFVVDDKSPLRSLTRSLAQVARIAYPRPHG